MYVPKLHEERDTGVLQSLVDAHPLGTWVTLGGGELVANHVPFLLDRSRGPLGTLIGHVAKANPVWQIASTGVESLIAFQGPEAYITPSWYPSKHAHGRAVPTWNYVVVHAHGLPRFTHDPAWLMKHLGLLTNRHEAAEARPWKMGDAPADFIARLVETIVGVEIPVARLVGKWKVSQNRPEPDRLGVVAGLNARGAEQAHDMAALVASHGSGPAAAPAQG